MEVITWEERSTAKAPDVVQELCGFGDGAELGHSFAGIASRYCRSLAWVRVRQPLVGSRMVHSRMVRCAPAMPANTLNPLHSTQCTQLP